MATGTRGRGDQEHRRWKPGNAGLNDAVTDYPAARLRRAGFLPNCGLKSSISSARAPIWPETTLLALTINAMNASVRRSTRIAGPVTLMQYRTCPLIS